MYCTGCACFTVRTGTYSSWVFCRSAEIPKTENRKQMSSMMGGQQHETKHTTQTTKQYYWGDWTSTADMAAMRQDRAVAQEWAARPSPDDSTCEPASTRWERSGPTGDCDGIGHQLGEASRRVPFATSQSSGEPIVTKTGTPCRWWKNICSVSPALFFMESHVTELPKRVTDKAIFSDRFSIVFPGLHATPFDVGSFLLSILAVSKPLVCRLVATQSLSGHQATDKEMFLSMQLLLLIQESCIIRWSIFLTASCLQSFLPSRGCWPGAISQGSFCVASAKASY